MKARHPSSRDCFNYSIKSNEMKNIVAEMNFMFSIREDERRAEETTSNELLANLVDISVTGCCGGVENGKTK
jgi:hypothetical protein